MVLLGEIDDTLSDSLLQKVEPSELANVAAAEVLYQEDRKQLQWDFE